MSVEAPSYLPAHSVMIAITDHKTGESLIPLDTPDAVRHVASGQLGIVFNVYPNETVWWFTFRLQKHLQLTWGEKHRTDITDAKDLRCYLSGLAAPEPMLIQEYGSMPMYLRGLRSIEVVVDW